MGCRICVEAVDKELVPLDFSMLLGTSPPTAFMPLNGYDAFTEPAAAAAEIMAPFACRRVASFPMVNKHQPPASSLKVRSISETDGLHKLSSSKLTLSDLKRELSHILEEDEKARSRSNSRPATPNGFLKPKKQVAFADDKGYELVTIKVMTEASDMPPKFSSGLLRRLLGEDALIQDSKPSSTWLIHFSQPASDYVNFRQNLEQQNVGLENVLVKNDTCRLAGTVKVKNIAFEKQVFLRITDNKWSSYMDRPAIYTKGIPGDMYDTFSFDFEVPLDDEDRHTLEFCVCFLASGHEHWDSNGGKNYQIVSESKKKKELESPNSGFRKPRKKYRGSDAFLMDYQNWSEFSVSALNEQGPYW